MGYNKLNIFYLALTEKECFMNGFCSRLDYQPVFGKISLALKHKSIQTGIQA